MLDQTSKRIIKDVADAIGLYRGLLVDAIEADCGSSDSWRYLRSRVLKLLGPRGLEGRILGILTNPSVPDTLTEK